MTDRWTDGHPDLDWIVDHLGGKLSGADEDEVRNHLESCLACRIEAMQLERFASGEDDAELAAEADWEKARTELDRIFEEELRPELATTVIRPSTETRSREATTTPDNVVSLPRRRAAGWLRWATPLAAAAAVTWLVFGSSFGPRSTLVPPLAPDTLGPMRGGGVDTLMTIEHLHPTGTVVAAPDTFAWRTNEGHEAYTLEIYTADLQTVYHCTDITATNLATPDSVRMLLAANTTYLWSVQARDGLAVTATSSECWFRIAP